VGTNTIRQNYSREGGLDYIVQDGGTITKQFPPRCGPVMPPCMSPSSTGSRAKQAGKKKLYRQLGDNRDSPWEVVEVDRINSALSTQPMSPVPNGCARIWIRALAIRAKRMGMKVFY
jgi:hypothetical protein